MTIQTGDICTDLAGNIYQILDRRVRVDPTKDEMLCRKLNGGKERWIDTEMVRDVCTLTKKAPQKDH